MNLDHTPTEARYLVKDGDSKCLCHECYNLRTGLDIWLRNSDIDDDYTEADAIDDFWLELGEG